MNGKYLSYRNRLLGLGSLSFVDWDADTIKAVLCRSSGYTPNLTADTVLSDIPSGARVATVTLASPVIANAIIDFADATFATVAAGAACDLVIIYKDTGTASTSPLIAKFDTFPAGMPVTPDGNNISLVLDVAGLLAA